MYWQRGWQGTMQDLIRIVSGEKEFPEKSAAYACNSVGSGFSTCTTCMVENTLNREVNLKTFLMRSSLEHLVGTNANPFWRMEPPLGLRRVLQKQKQT